MGVASGTAHFRAAERRRTAHAAEELRSLSKLRAHHGKAAADCRRTVRHYESTLQELRLLQQARASAQEAKQASGASLITPAVESGAERTEDEASGRLQSVGQEAHGKLTMFHAKHSVDYLESISFHMQNTQDEEHGVNTDLAGASNAFARVSRNSNVELVGG